MRKYYTSESVTEGHPDKVCDQIADAILDAILSEDKNARVACEVVATTGLVMVMGEVTTTTYVDIQEIVRKTVMDIGYNRGKIGFDAENLAVLVCLDEQSPDIALGVKDGEGAGDQGLMFGFACQETEELMPMPIVLAHKLTKRLSELRKSMSADYLRPDGKAQVTVEYYDNRPVRVDSVVISTQHHESVKIAELRTLIIKEVIMPVIPASLLDDDTKIFVNPTGRFVIGGPKADSGLTGRKIIVDTYGGAAHHGGGAFSGKDPTKVDRSASYMARYIAKNMVAAGVALTLEVGLSYVIGVSEPTAVLIDTFGTSGYQDEDLICIIRELFPLTPKAIIEHFDLCRPLYLQVASYGHFGRNDLSLPWEKLDMVDKIKEKLYNLRPST
ncbi:MAG: methionine adenosyltransferase [Bacilli bacterium]|nr:methionine adenosyltransferase [Bacilli bacterium]MDD4076702.1 methionine adenosyltransferase [Bacilli bacterium]